MTKAKYDESDTSWTIWETQWLQDFISQTLPKIGDTIAGDQFIVTYVKTHCHFNETCHTQSPIRRKRDDEPTESESYIDEEF